MYDLRYGIIHDIINDIVFTSDKYLFKLSLSRDFIKENVLGDIGTDITITKIRLY